jgi:hypothetical protein
MKKDTTNEEETPVDEKAPGPILTRLIITRNWARKHRVAVVGTLAGFGLAAITANQNTKLRAQLDDCECEMEELGAGSDADYSSTEDILNNDDTND